MIDYCGPSASQSEYVESKVLINDGESSMEAHLLGGESKNS